ncbi:FKBP-type peptidyl-prolyl cis-trans isomerase [Gaetbulibacter saemankumensis]|uniref:FKBP-type peptidyl-prolyl cis-trans isomerase n=1 Tax=Gaetbulibacter saemankumensis TaxID=311208 RepID=UPI000416D85D|nr:FKBP-type peptidyl-prolyl cis-trans isomerase [Gaetbulibacter saemankumensis]
MKHILFVLTLILATSCSKDEYVDYTEQNEKEIQAYIAENNLNAQRTTSGLYYVINEQGTGEKPIGTDRVKVIYKGYFTNGEVFDESSEEGASFILQYVISGFAEGMAKFNEGGHGKLIIPAHLAYGSSQHNNIPAGSVLIFDVELVYVNFKTENDIAIQNYLTENNIEAEKTESGLYYVVETPGTGEYPISTDRITVTYKGYFLDDTVFDESTSDITFYLNNVIEGWQEGFTYFNEGSSGKLFIPAHLAYGNYDFHSIPGGSVLIFDINLISIQ